MQRRPAAFTLAELVISTAIMTILLGSMASALLIATQALPDEGSSLDSAAEAITLVDQIVADLSLATTAIVFETHVVEFTVPDRGHGDAGPETVRYEWSGDPGGPLTHQYNECDEIVLCEDVHGFSLSYTRTTTGLQGAPRVLLIVGSGLTPNSQDEAKRTLIESWGFPVDVQAASATEEEIGAAAGTADVTFVSGEIQELALAPKIKSLPIGVVCEKRLLYPNLGLSMSSVAFYDHQIVVVDNTHEITSAFVAGPLTTCSQQQSLGSPWQGVAPGARVLAEAPSLGYEALIVIEADGELYGGGNAQGRRVSLPWGNDGFDFDTLNPNGRTLMRRAIVWAAAPVVYSSARITLQLGSDATSQVHEEFQLLNTPRAN